MIVWMKSGAVDTAEVYRRKNVQKALKLSFVHNDTSNSEEDFFQTAGLQSEVVPLVFEK